MTKATKNKNRRIGQGMKPRVLPAKNPLQAATEEKAVSAASVPDEMLREPTVGSQDVSEKGVDLESETVQNLETGVVAESERERLAKMMQESADDDGEEEMSETEPDVAVSEEVKAAVETKWAEVLHKATPEVRERVKQDVLAELAEKEQQAKTIGEREDGTFGIVISVPEGVIEGIRQQAESDRITPEEWASMRFAEYMQDWWQPAASR